MKKQTIRLIVWMVVLLLSMAVVAVAGIWYALNREGLTQSVRQQISDELAAVGVTAPPSAIHGTLSGEVVIEGPVFRDARLGDMVVFEAKRLIVELDLTLLLRRKYQINQIRVQDGRLHVPIEQQLEMAEVIELEQLNVTITPRGRNLILDHASGVLEGIPFDVSGTVERGPKSKIRPAGPPSIARFLPENLGAEWRGRVQEIMELVRAVGRSRDPMLKVRIVESETRGRPAVEIRLQFRDCLYNGLAFQQMQVSCDWQPDGRITADLHGFLDGGDYLTLDGNYNWKTGMLSGDADFRGYPMKIRKALRLPASALSMVPEFSGEPPRLQVTLAESPAKALDQWRLSFRLEADRTHVVDADLRDVIADGEWQNGTLTVHRARGSVVEPAADFDGTLDYRLADGELAAVLHVTGNPRCVTLFTRSENFQHDYLTALAGFDWRGGGRPRATINICRTMVNGQPNTIVTGEGLMHGVRFNGVPVERASATFMVDPTRKLVILDRLDLVVDGHQAHVALAWDFAADPPELRFDGGGTVSVPSLLQMIDPDLPARFGKLGITFPVPVQAQARGIIDLKGDHRVRFSGTAAAAGMTVKDSLWRQVAGTLNYDSKSEELTVMGGTAEQLTVRGWTVEGLSGDCRINGANVRFSGQAAHGTNQTVELWDAAAFLTMDGGGLHLTTNGRAGRVGAWNFSGLSTDTQYNDGQLKVDAVADKADYAGRWRFARVAGNWFDEPDKPAHFSYCADSASSADGTLADLTITGDLDDDWIAGKATSLHARTSDEAVSGTGLAGVFYQEGDAILIDGSAATVRVGPHWQAAEAAALVQSRGNLPLEIQFAAASAAIDKGDVQAFGISGRLTHDKSNDDFEMRVTRISGADWSGEAVEAVGVRSPHALIASVSSAAAGWHGWHGSSLAGRMVLADGQLSLQGMRATVADGAVTGDAMIGLKERAGHLRIDGRGLKPAMLMPNSPSAVAIGGKIDLVGNLEFSSIAGELKLEGPGRVALTDGNVWRVPLLDDFMRALDRFVPSGELTKITRVETDLLFEGGRVHCPDITSNGSLVALQGDGWYKWQGGAIDFRVRAKPLPAFFLNRILAKVPIVSNLIGQSFDVLLERRLEGTIQEPKWEEVTAIRDIFRNRDRSTTTEDKEGNKPE